MKKLFKVGKEFFEKKSEAKLHRNELEGYIPVADKDGRYPNHKWKYEIKRGPDHRKGESK